MKAAALRGALSDRARAEQVHVVTSFVEGDTPSTKSARKVLESVTEARRVLAVLLRTDEVSWVSLRNLPHVHIIAPDQLNTYDVLVNDDVVFTKDALDVFLASKAQHGQGSAEATATSSDADEEAAK
jgi:large subunit ribosomal protein L4